MTILLQPCNVITFYGPKSPFSLYYPCKFTINFNNMNLTFTSSKQYIIYMKATIFGDLIKANKIIKEKSSNNLKNIKIKNFDEKEWGDVKYDIIYKGNKLKFTQNLDLKNILLNTNNKVLIKTGDNVWGIGLGSKHIDIYNPNKWKGNNLLGIIIMKVRNSIKQSEIINNKKNKDNKKSKKDNKTNKK